MKVKYYEYEGDRKSISEWARIFNIPYTTFYDRLARGVPFETARKKSCGRPARRKILYNGKEYTYSQLAEIAVVDAVLIRQRITKMGWPVELAINTPKRVAGRKYYKTLIDNKECRKYDCVHQDGSGICQIRKQRKGNACESYVDAYAYYYGGQKADSKTGEDPWAKERNLLIGHVILRESDSAKKE